MGQTTSLDDRTLVAETVPAADEETPSFDDVLQALRDGVRLGLDKYDAQYQVNQITPKSTKTASGDRKYTLTMYFETGVVSGMPLDREMEETIRKSVIRQVLDVSGIDDEKHTRASFK